MNDRIWSQQEDDMKMEQEETKSSRFGLKTFGQRPTVEGNGSGLLLQVNDAK